MTRPSLSRTMFQSTPPRGRRLPAHVAALINRFVSIHASAREATARQCKRPPGGLVSIHASAREATLPAPVRAPTTPCFNPRLRAGGDRTARRPISTVSQFQSTPPRGRRPGSGRLPRPLGLGFNPRLRAGGDPPVETVEPVTSEFQSTPPRGRRLAELSELLVVVLVSIHASAREATRHPDTRLVEGGVSIHASAREATADGRDRHGPAPVSIHASAREATLAALGRSVE